MIYVARRILYATIPGFIFEHVRKHKRYRRNNKHLPLEYALTSRRDLGETKYALKLSVLCISRYILKQVMAIPSYEIRCLC